MAECYYTITAARAPDLTEQEIRLALGKVYRIIAEAARAVRAAKRKDGAASE